MKVTGQSSLIAAQAIGAQRTNTDAKAASAAFFAELKKSNAPTSQTATTQQLSATTDQKQSTAQNTAQRIAKMPPTREAPMRAQEAASGAPLPPGSYLNIVV